MFVCTFRYRPKHVACYLCTEYKQKQGCTLPVCPWLAERIEAGVVGYQEAVMATIPREPTACTASACPGRQLSWECCGRTGHTRSAWNMPRPGCTTTDAGILRPFMPPCSC